MNSEINWGVFEPGVERESARKLYDAGSIRLIPSVVVEMTTDKELEIQKMANMKDMSYLNVESEVAREFKAEEAKLGKFPIETPEDEARWQAKFDAERAAMHIPNAEVPAVLGRVSDTNVDDKPKCEVCGREFGNKGLKTMHMKTHDAVINKQPAAANA